MDNNKQSLGADIIQSVNVIEIIKKVGKRNRRLQAILLNEIESNIDKNSPGFEKVRKLLLDETNSFTRAVIRDIFGDIEYLLRN